MITKADIAALKKAQRVLVRMKGEGAEVTIFTPIPRPKVPKGFETDVSIPDDATYTFTARASWNYDQAPQQATWHAYRAGAGAWKALTLIARAGDELTFSIGNGANGYVEAAILLASRLNERKTSDYHHPDYDHLYLDLLYVTLTRNGREILRDLLLEYSACPNNTTRPVSR